MNRRECLSVLFALTWASRVNAGGLDAITASEAAQALRESLTRGAEAAITRLGRENGYFGNAKIKIGLPKKYDRADKLLRALGQGKKVDDLVLAMNRAAEQAVPKAQPLVLEAIKRMTLEDAKAILKGGDDAATQYFRTQTEAPLAEAMLPVIKSVTEQSGLARAYNTLARKLVQLAGLQSERATVEDYVNKQAISGLYALVAEEERALRADPSRYAGGLIGKVFGLIH